ncbi:hypothetical protein LTR86_007211 [Recurvomyces mirabilis]|nr:hypothetical protein LTR86_007211 [Recurvomyces mirabilis]
MSLTTSMQLGKNTSSQYMVGQIYVERLQPAHIRHEYPLVFIAGNGQSGSNWLNTPDGREGWASYFVRQGYEIYLTDQTLRGRSPWLPIPGGPESGNVTAYSTTQTSSLFTAPQAFDPLPYLQAVNHTQWPGTGLPGDEVFDAFYASQLQTVSSTALVARDNNASYTALLDRIGAAVVVTHSQAGSFGWQLGDARPDLVKAIIALEPSGPPFANWLGAPFPPGYQNSELRPFGLTALPLVYEPDVGANASLLSTVTIPARDNQSAPCMLQAAPAKRLVNLGRIPVLMLTSEASYHAVYDYCTAAYLQQAGVNLTYVDLPEMGIHGNGHFIFLEKNNLQVAEEVVMPWLLGVDSIVSES